MKIAIPYWQSRVSPVCDEARRFLVVQLDDDDREVSRREEEITLPGSDPVGRAGQLRQWGVDTVICGAISQSLEGVLTGVGIQVLARVCGGVEDVLQAYRKGCLDQDRFVLPGCARRRRRRREGRCLRDEHHG